jgi:hypothetical protein
MRYFGCAAAALLVALPFCPAHSQAIPGYVSTNNPGFNDFSGAVYGFYDLSWEEHGTFLTHLARNLTGSQILAAGTAVCVFYGGDPKNCSDQVSHTQDQIGKVANVVRLNDTHKQDQGFYILAPPGYDACQVIVNLYDISSGSTLNASFFNYADNKDPHGPFYIAIYTSVPIPSGGSERAKARFAVQFTPIGKAVHAPDGNPCLPEIKPILKAKGANICYDAVGRYHALTEDFKLGKDLEYPICHN